MNEERDGAVQGAARPTHVAAWLLLLFGLYVATRTPRPLVIPSFVDESIHIQRALLALKGELPLGDLHGKWLSVYMMAGFVGLLPLHTLESVRLASVGMGLGTLLMCVAIGKELYSWRTGIIAGLLYVILPYALFYNRLALMDGFVALFGMVSLSLSIRTVRTKELIYPFLLGLALTLAVLSKLSGIVLVGVPILTVLFLAPRPQWRPCFLRILPGVSVALLAAAYLLLNDSGLSEIANKTSPLALISRQLVVTNISSLADWYGGLFTPPIAVLAMLSALWVTTADRSRPSLLLLTIWGLLVVPYVMAAKVWFPRYIVPALVPLILVMAHFLEGVAQRLHERARGWRFAAAITIGATALLAWPVLTSATVILSPQSARLPDIVRWQYFEGWPSGYGLPELAEAIAVTSRSSDDGVNLIRLSYAGPAYQGLDLYLEPSEAIHVYTLTAWEPQSMARLAEINGNGRRSLLVVHAPDNLDYLKASLVAQGIAWPGATLVWQYTKPGNQSRLEVWQLGSGGPGRETE